eukprot:6197659-Pleurochrysis_carterae.AAC.1
MSSSLQHVTRHYPDGQKYVGTIRADLFDGHGTFIYRNGQQYDGEWRSGVRHGHGVVITPDGDRHEGYWVNNVMQDVEDVQGGACAQAWRATFGLLRALTACTAYNVCSRLTTRMHMAAEVTEPGCPISVEAHVYSIVFVAPQTCLSVPARGPASPEPYSLPLYHSHPHKRTQAHIHKHTYTSTDRHARKHT